jgi:hypothetical protein
LAFAHRLPSSLTSPQASTKVDDAAKDWDGDKSPEKNIEDEGKARDTYGSNKSQESDNVVASIKEFNEERDTDEFWDGMKRNEQPEVAREAEEQEIVEKLSKRNKELEEELQRLSKLLEESSIEHRSADQESPEEERTSAASAFQFGGLIAALLHVTIKLWIG